MKITEASVPVDLLLSRELTASGKVIWMVIYADRHVEQHVRFSPTRLARRTGITRNTIRKVLSLFANSGWKIRSAPSGATPKHRRSPLHVRIPISLLTDRSIPARARALYGVLQQTPRFDRRRGNGELTYASLGKLVGLQARTVKKGIIELAKAGWLEIEQRHRRAPVRFRLIDPATLASERQLPGVKRRVDKAKYFGEALMREYLSQIVESEDFEDDAAPGFLVNPLTGERLQLDRYYPRLGVAFEFNGPHHYGATESVSAEDATMQRVRDLIKTGICAQRGITIIVVHPDDLYLNAMRNKVGSLLPLRQLDSGSPVIRYLENRSRRYRRFFR